MTLARRQLIVCILVVTSGLPGLQRMVQAADQGAEGKANPEEATRLYLDGRYEEAAERLAQISLRHPELPGPQRKLGLCYYYLRRPEPALLHLRAYLALKQEISPEDREDVERWIRELETLRAQTVVGLNAQPGASPGLPFAAPTRGQAANAPVGEGSTLPAFRRGLLFLPHIGMQFPVHGRNWISSGFQFGFLVGGHLSGKFSLSGEVAVATWTFSDCAGTPYCMGHHGAVQLDASAILLRHVHRSWGDYVFGPKLGWAVALRNNPAEETFPYINGLQVGGKLGMFRSLAPSFAVGPLVDLTYIRGTLATTPNKCFSNTEQPDCSHTGNTVVVSVGLAVLL